MYLRLSIHTHCGSHDTSGTATWDTREKDARSSAGPRPGHGAWEAIPRRPATAIDIGTYIGIRHRPRHRHRHRHRRRHRHTSCRAETKNANRNTAAAAVPAAAGAPSLLRGSVSVIRQPLGMGTRRRSRRGRQVACRDVLRAWMAGSEGYGPRV